MTSDNEAIVRHAYHTAGIVHPTGVKVDGPCADFWYLRDGKIERFDSYIMFDTMRAQMGVPERGQ